MAAAPLVRRAGDDVARLDDLLDLFGGLERRQRDAVRKRGRLRDVGPAEPGSGARRRTPAASASGPLRSGRGRARWAPRRRCRRPRARPPSGASRAAAAARPARPRRPAARAGPAPRRPRSARTTPTAMAATAAASTETHRKGVCIPSCIGRRAQGFSAHDRADPVHHALGLTDGVHAFADGLRAAGRMSSTSPDLFEGRASTEIRGGRRVAEEVGFEHDRIERGRAAAEELPNGIVYAGMSLGVMPAYALATMRQGARGALFLHACVGPWASGLPLQVHLMAATSWAAEDLAGRPHARRHRAVHLPGRRARVHRPRRARLRRERRDAGQRSRVLAFLWRRRSPARGPRRGRRGPRSRSSAGSGRPARPRPSPRPTGASSPAGPRSATRRRRATRRAMNTSRGRDPRRVGVAEARPCRRSRASGRR